jgi:preprotein translocase subunit SecG
MMTFISVVHILVAILLITLVLIQDSKGGGALGIGGGGSNSVVGATGAVSLWAKMTRVVALVFALTCIALTYITAQHTKSVIDTVPAAATTAPSAVTNPAAPAPEAAAPQNTATEPAKK